MKLFAISEQPDLPEANLLCGLVKHGVEVHWLGLAKAKQRSLLEHNAVRFHEFSLPSKFSLKAIKQIRTLLKQLSPQIVYSFSGRALSNVLIASLGMSQIKHLAYRGTVGHLSRLDPVSYLTFLNPKLAKIICVSKAVERYLLEQGVPATKLVTIYKGHDPAWYENAPQLSRSEFHIPEDAAVVICTANMRPVKGVDLLLEAMLKIPAEKNLHLILVGEVRDPKIAELLKDPALLNRVHALGYRTDVASLINLSDIVVQPSREREGFPKAVLEGMALGKGAIVTNVGGMPELIRDKHTGLVIEACNVNALYQALLTVCETPAICKSLGHAARRSLEENFSIAMTVKQHYELVSRL